LLVKKSTKTEEYRLKVEKKDHLSESFGGVEGMWLIINHL
jgi:hypothetical protein